VVLVRESAQFETRIHGIGSERAEIHMGCDVLFTGFFQRVRVAAVC